MMWLSGVVLAFGIFNVGLGLFAYFQTGSLPSLIAAGVAGILLIAFAALSRTKPTIGYGGAFLICLALLGRFAGPFFSQTQWYPAGLMVFTSAIVLICLVIGHFQIRRSTGASS
jgi:uncharacterized membrane protein (UPF0136 family)